jgi:hypothetical protein
LDVFVMRRVSVVIMWLRDVMAFMFLTMAWFEHCFPSYDRFPIGYVSEWE